MRLLLINPNTTVALTDRLAGLAREALPGIEVVAASGAFGAPYIADRASFAIAGHAALDAFARHGGGADVVLLACFGDPGLDALREVADRPVIGLVEAACGEASRRGRYSVVTGGENWGAMLREAVRLRHLDGALASIRTVAPTGGMIASDPEGAADLLRDACTACADVDGAATVVLGGAGLAGLADRLRPTLAVDVICSVTAGLRAVAAALAAPPSRGRPGRLQSRTIGLSPELAALLQRPVTQA